MRRLDQIDLNGAAIVVAVFFLAISFGADAAKNDFVSRLFLTASGAAMSVFITLTIVQWAIKEDRDKQ
jgi:uncharacterized membrane protein YccC